MSRVYVGNLDPRVTERDLEDEFRIFGVLRSVWVARRPPGYAFIEFDDRRDAIDAIRELDGVVMSVVNLVTLLANAARVMDHEAWEVAGVEAPVLVAVGVQVMGMGAGGVKDSFSFSLFIGVCRGGSYSPLGGRSPRRRSITPRRGRSYSRSPPYRYSRRDSPYANGAPLESVDLLSHRSLHIVEA
ncbi:hypothetical protein GOBAR_AA23628 [Gossypium barbadense]|uniref:RRM domain-containing protein n=1 Tax=Gossypium barbadense TaxID=3634 RepID=A0A2P5X104_GOSBA|nr:hypothetical protein GOBAR_AA23628 [Gossypium barbadense]